MRPSTTLTYDLGSSSYYYANGYMNAVSCATVSATGAITGDDIVAQASSDRTYSAIAADTSLCQIRLYGNGAGQDYGITSRFNTEGMSIAPLSDWGKRVTLNLSAFGPGSSGQLDLGTSSVRWNTGYTTNHNTQGIVLAADSNRTNTNITADSTLSQLYFTGNGTDWHNICLTTRYGTAGLTMFPSHDISLRVTFNANGFGPGTGASNTGLGTTSAPWGSFYCTTASVGGTSTLRDCNPATNNTYSLGTTSLRWKKGWFTDIDSTNAVNVSSDARLKKEIQPLDKAKTVRFVNSLRPVSYKLDPDRVREADSDTHIGLIAQEVKASMECVFGTSTNQSLLSTSDDGVMGLRYTELIASLITCVQDLTARVDFLEKYRESTIKYGGEIDPFARDVISPSPDAQLPPNKKYKMT
jgi:hypothetical protein